MMLCRYVVVLLLPGLFSSCARKLYQKNDYTFYDSSFVPDTSSALRTDGVYVLTRDSTKQSKEPRFYKFYRTGQCNLTLDLTSEIKTQEDYINTVSKDFSEKARTLFEGYYKLEKDRVIIQSVVVPRRQFRYQYGFVKQDSLIIVKATTRGKGKFKDKYFTDYYKEYYIFKPLDIKNEGLPKW